MLTVILLSKTILGVFILGVSFCSTIVLFYLFVAISFL